jgi:hypothetical protein
MTIPSSPVKLSNIKAEFGSNMPTTANNLLSYLEYPGGVYVGATPFTSGIPTVAPITITQFASKAATYTANTSSYNSTGTFVETIPSGVKQVTIQVWGGSGGAGTSLTPYSGGSGGSGGFSSSTYILSGTNWGQTFTVDVGSRGKGGTNASTPGTNGGASTVTNGTFNIPLTMIAPGGGGGASGNAPSLPRGSGGSIGTGGQYNQIGVDGGTGVTLPTTSVIGGPGVVAKYGTGAPGGTATVGPGLGAPGGIGLVLFHYS